MAFVNFFKQKWQAILAVEQSPEKLARALTLGLWIAFSPFLGLQTPLIFIIAPLMGLSSFIVFTTVYVVNNPWTMIPIIVLDYYVGYFIVEKWLGFNLHAYNPGFMTWVNEKLQRYLSSYLGTAPLCFWCFICGGLVVSLIVASISYPILRYCCKRIRRTRAHHEDYKHE